MNQHSVNKKIEIYEVGPRDGFQNLKEYIPVQEKLNIIHSIVASGVTHVQITSFVSPKAIPQLKDGQQVAETCLKQYKHVDFLALTPNLRGAELAWETGIRHISYVVSVSESHNKANINRTHPESLDELRRIVHAYPDFNICVDLATTFGCPYEGKKTAEQITAFMQSYVELGIQEFDLCDTIGVANPRQVHQVIDQVTSQYSDLTLQVHIHDTRNMGMACTLAAVEAGVSRVQSTLGGLGGCPFAPGASGNLASEDLVYMLHDMGYETGISFKSLLAAARYEMGIIPQGCYSGHHIKIDQNNNVTV